MIKGWRVAFENELQALLTEVICRVKVWTGREAWQFEPASPASFEVSNREKRLDGTPWGERPIRTVYQYAQMATKFAAEMSQCVADLLAPDRPPPGLETLTRGALESASVAYWLLVEGLTARQRVCRMQLLRRNSARELNKSMLEVGADPALAGRETIPSIEAECRALGLAPFTHDNELEGEKRLGYTGRVKLLTDEWGFKGAYNIYSGVAHAELTGIWRLFQQTASTAPGEVPIFHPGPDHNATFAAVHGALISMIAPMEKIALLFGWRVRGEEIGATIDYINCAMARLRP